MIKIGIFLVLICLGQCQDLLTSIKNYADGIAQSNITQKILIDFAPLLLPLTILSIILIQLMKICFKRQKFYDKLPQTEQQANKKTIKLPLKHKMQLYFMRYYCQFLRLFTH
ncbi:unnamed protein product [Paramecium primaurelia]|uniref:Transmembrane protein n=2 Tax=Paramecium TaxID=5884 RepID=A0A8S1UW11_9CILI|nr:unnamed protein product [Paramecium primaurelia]CAD8168634.1 unnamed protein product [Paramecium pentaurelia]